LDEIDKGLGGYRSTFNNPGSYTQRDGKTVQYQSGDEALILPKDGKMTILDIGNFLGGGGTNVAVALGRLGIPTQLVGCIGGHISAEKPDKVEADENGHKILVRLKSAAVDVSFISVVAGAATRRSNVYTLEDNDKNRLAFTKKHPNRAPRTANHLRFPLRTGGGKVIGFVSSRRNVRDLENIVDRLTDTSEAEQIVINPGNEEMESREDMTRILSKVALATANREEWGRFEAKQDDESDLEWLSRIQARMGDSGLVVMTDGTNGSTVVAREMAISTGMYEMQREAEELPNAIRLGSGDAAASGWVMNLTLGQGNLTQEEYLKRGLYLAAISSAMVCTAHGACERTLSKEDFRTAHSLEMTEYRIDPTA
jgi:sugar/nucleoside kinase (ribokinase family)